MKSTAQILFKKHLTELGIGWVEEYRFHGERKWRFDFLLCNLAPVNGSDIAIEIEGAIHTGGRHTTGSGYQKDLDKYNAATMMGYRVLRFSTTDVLRGRAKAFLAEHLK